MNVYLETAKLGKVYLKRYWLRFVLGIILGIGFGFSNPLFLGSAYLMIQRLDDPEHIQEVAKEKLDQEAAEKKLEARATKGQPDIIESRLKVLRQEGVVLESKLMAAVDPWLPLKGRALDWKQILGCLLLLPAIAALRGFLGYGSSYLLAWSGQRITNDVRLDVFKKVSSLSLDFFHKTTTGELINRIETDSVGLNNFLKLGLSDLIKEPTTIIGVFACMLAIDWKLTLISVAFLPICVIPTRKISQKLKELGRRDFGANIGQSNVTMESFINVRITKAYALEAAHAKAYAKAGNRSMRFTMKSVQNREMLNPIVQSLFALGISFVLLYAVWTNCSFAKLFLFFGALISFQSPFKRLSGIGVYLTQLSLSLERLLELLGFEPTVKEDLNPVALPRFSQGIRFKNVDFSYGEGPVVQNISFDLPRGQRLGLAGESGSGKSSLLNLFFRFYDVTGGVIEIDGIPIERYRISDLRSQLALVSQDVLLFNATVAENIGFGKEGATRAEIEDAARRAHATAFINELPLGYDTPLGERGTRLSGGQRQRIAIARAFVRNAPILVLDEATASLDSKSEAEVQSAIDELAENRTVVCVAHRLSTLRGMNTIIVMDRGRIIEQGGFDELLLRQGAFAAMAARQSIYYKADEQTEESTTAAR